MERDGEPFPIAILVDSMAPALADENEPLSFNQPYYLFCRQSRQFHAVTSMFAIEVISGWRISSLLACRSSMWSFIASFMLAITSSYVSPCAYQPWSSGQYA